MCTHHIGNTAGAKDLYREVSEQFPNTKLAAMAADVLAKIEEKEAAAEQAKEKAAESKASGTTTKVAAKHAKSPESSKSEPKEEEDFESVSEAIIPDDARAYFTRVNNDIWVDVKVNGRRTKMQYDTGAEGTLLTKSQAEELGLRLPTGKTECIGVGIGGEIHGWRMKVEIEVGGVKRRLPVEISESGDSSLLGQRFFGDLEYEIDNKGNCLYFRKKRVGKDATLDKFCVPFTKVGKNLLVNVSIDGNDGKSTPMLVDTGAHGIVMSKQNWVDLGIVVPNDAGKGSHVGVGEGYNNSFDFEVDNLRLGPIVARSPKVSIIYEHRNADGTLASGENRCKEGLLGMDFFSGWRFTIDNANRVLRFFH